MTQRTHLLPLAGASVISGANLDRVALVRYGRPPGAKPRRRMYHARMPRLRCHVVIAIAVVQAACSAASPPATPAPAPLDTTWYISARARAEGRDTKSLSDSLEYGLIITARSPSKDLVTSANLPFKLVDSVTLSRALFVSTLRARTSTEDGKGFAVLYTHGFGTSLHEAWKQGVHARARSQGSHPWVVFNWPAGDNWVTWPERGSLISTSYWQDSTSAEASRGPFVQAFGAVREAVGSVGLVLFTHSMGVQVVAEALMNDDTLRAALTADPLRGAAFYAPDVEASRFGDVLVPAFRPLAQRLVLYASANDRALAMARRFTHTERAGQVPRSGHPLLSRAGLETVDVTEATNALGIFRKSFGTRHGVRHASAALFDLVHLVAGGYEAGCREQLGIATRIAADSWKLGSNELPSPTAVSQCTARRSTGFH